MKEWCEKDKDKKRKCKNHIWNNYRQVNHAKTQRKTLWKQTFSFEIKHTHDEGGKYAAANNDAKTINISIISKCLHSETKMPAIIAYLDQYRLWLSFIFTVAVHRRAFGCRPAYWRKDYGAISMKSRIRKCAVKSGCYVCTQRLFRSDWMVCLHLFDFQPIFSLWFCWWMHKAWRPCTSECLGPRHTT